MDYHVALAIGAAVILIYTFMGGFMAVCVTDFIQGSLMLVGLLVVPIAAYFMEMCIRDRHSTVYGDFSSSKLCAFVVSSSCVYRDALKLKFCVPDIRRER